MKEILIYLLAAIASLTILGYSIHMLVGGLVDRTTEVVVIAVACLLGLLVIAYMAWDIIRRRRGY